MPMIFKRVILLLSFINMRYMPVLPSILFQIKDGKAVKWKKNLEGWIPKFPHQKPVKTNANTFRVIEWCSFSVKL